MFHFLLKKHSVFLLIKILLVLGVLAILVVAALVVYPGVRDINQANTEISNLGKIKENINKFYASQGGHHRGFSWTAANQARVFPKSMNDGNFTATDDIRSSWAGAVNISNSIEMPADTQQPFYTIEYHDVPAGVCLMLVSGAAPMFEQVKINGRAIFTDHSDARRDAYEGGRFNTGKAAEACTTGEISTIEFTAR